MAINTAQDLFVEQLRDIYSAEKQAIRAYPKVTKKSTSPELKQALTEHLEQTKGQLERLDRVFEILGKKSSGKTCEAMKGLIEEVQEALEEIEKGPVLDAAIIAAGQRIEHYEIASYGTVAAFAELMGQSELHDLLAETLQEEKETDEHLTEVAHAVNSSTLQEDEEEDEEQSQPRKSARKLPSKKAGSAKKR
ncbi:MAG TPA: ferritin-like domain-containing protein [Acidobacteriaceae bacterium]|nr:ferritin-like domain-containing protein [Acidobacteriaceae bacterium]